MNLLLPHDCLAVFIDDTGNELLNDPVQKVFGLGGCAAMASQLDAVIRQPWLDVRRIIGGSTDARLHATDIRDPTPEQINVVASFFKDNPFSRFGAICSVETDLNNDISPFFAVATCVGNRLADILKWQPFTSVAVIFEHSERLEAKLEESFGALDLKEDGKSIPLEFYWMDKSDGEPALEVADFIANSIGTEVRHRIAGKPGHAKNFEAFFHHHDRRLVSFMDARQVKRGEN